MNQFQRPIDRRLMPFTLLAIAGGAALVGLSYWLVDWRVAQWVAAEQFGERMPWLKWPTYLSWWIEILALIAIVILVPARATGAYSRWQAVLLAAALSVTVASGIAEQSKYLFGRPWPETWRNDNSSYIRNGDYTFRWLHGSDEYGSFPSGHTTVACAAMSVFSVAWPRMRIFAAIVVIAVVLGLVANNYHFVGDTIGGAVLGSLTGIWSCAVFGVGSPKRSSFSLGG